MRILWISHFIPYPPKSGMLVRSYNLLYQLCLDNDVDIIALARTDTLRGMFSSPEAGILAARNALSAICGSVIFVPTSIGRLRGPSIGTALKSMLPGPPYSVRWLTSKDMAQAISDAIKERRYDLVHYDTIGLAQYARPENSGIPLVMDHHNIESHMLFRRVRREPNPVKKLYFWQEALRLRHYEKQSCRHFDLHLTCSAIDSQRLRKMDQSLNIVTVPNGVDINLFRPDLSVPKDNSLIFIGGQEWYPNRDAMEYFANEIWPDLSRRNPHVEFNLIGGNPSESVVAASQRDSRFNVHGFVEDIHSYMNRANVYVCPIRDGGGTKIKILDALAMGKAIVAHPLAVEGIDVTAGKSVLLARTPEEFIKAIEDVLRDDELRRRMERSARELAKTRYSYDTIGEEFRRLYATTTRPNSAGQ